jgi:hypothetical protein
MKQRQDLTAAFQQGLVTDPGRRPRFLPARGASITTTGAPPGPRGGGWCGRRGWGARVVEDLADGGLTCRGGDAALLARAGVAVDAQVFEPMGGRAQ